jgi:hypothetical protein
MRLATWNLAWASPRSAKGARIRSKLAAVAADVWVITEGRLALVPDGGHLIDAGDDWGYGDRGDCRKVVAWSSNPWYETRRVDQGAARGRLVAGVTDSVTGPVRLIAVCIPWRGAHVSTGRRDAVPWAEHREFCEQLRAFRAELDPAVPTIIAGDFNQRIPRTLQPAVVAKELDEALEGIRVWTSGQTTEGQLIDHIAGDAARLVAARVSAWPASTGQDRLSDHSGVLCEIKALPSSRGASGSSDRTSATQAN